MVEIHRAEQWDHTSSLMALVANLTRGRSCPPYRPSDFHPLIRRTPTPAQRVDFDALRAFVQARPPPSRTAAGGER